MSAAAEHGRKRQRLLDAIEFRPVDRLPFQGSTVTVEAIDAELGAGAYAAGAKEAYARAMKAWDTDIVMQFVLPDRQDRRCGPMAAVDTGRGLLSAVRRLLEERIARDGPIGSPEDFRDFCLSLPAAGGASAFVDPEETALRWRELMEWGDFLKPLVWVPGHLCGTVGWMWYTTVGYENYLIAHQLYPEALERLFAFLGEEGRLRNRAIARVILREGYLPMLYSGEDICDNTGPLCSPRILRETYFPHLRRAVEPIRDAGIHWLWHSDGNILPILPDLMACGIDGYQGFEEDKKMDLHVLAGTPCANGRLPFLCGSVSVSTTFYRGPDAVRADVDRIRGLASARGGGIILSPSSSIMADTPAENVLAFLRRARGA